MSKVSFLGAAAFLPLLLLALPASAQSTPDGVQLKPLLDARLRYETVDQGTLDADALTGRMRAGLEATAGKLSLLAEGEGTLALVDNYNAFPFLLRDESQRRPQYAVVPGGISDRSGPRQIVRLSDRL